MNKFHEIKHDFDYNLVSNKTNININIDSINGKWTMNDLSNWVHQMFDGVYGKRILDGVLKNIVIIDESKWKEHLIREGQPEYVIGFVDENGINYIPSNESFHTAVHEILHKISNIRAEYSDEHYKDSDNNIRRITGIREFYKNGFDSNMINEILTEYLTSKYTDGKIYAGSIYGAENCEYFRRIDDCLYRLYGDNDILLQCYISNNTNYLKELFDKYIYKNSYYEFAFSLDSYYKKDSSLKLDKIVRKLEKNTKPNKKISDIFKLSR